MEMKRGRGLNRVVVLPKILKKKRRDCGKEGFKKVVLVAIHFCGLLNGCESLTNFTTGRKEFGESKLWGICPDCKFNRLQNKRQRGGLMGILFSGQHLLSCILYWISHVKTFGTCYMHF